MTTNVSGIKDLKRANFYYIEPINNEDGFTVLQELFEDSLPNPKSFLDSHFKSHQVYFIHKRALFKMLINKLQINTVRDNVRIYTKDTKQILTCANNEVFNQACAKIPGN
jgi:hypothetical protein